MQALEDDEMMRKYATLLARQDTAREDALKALQARTAMRAEVAGLEVTNLYSPSRACTCDSTQYDTQVIRMYTGCCFPIIGKALHTPLIV